MADDYGTTDERVSHGTARTKFDEAAASTKSLADQALSVGEDLKGKAKDLAQSSTDAIRGHASDLADAAKDVAGQATDKLKEGWPALVWFGF